MQPLSSKAGGTCFAMPDVCLTPAPPGPPVPVPYPNTAQMASANGAITVVLAENKETIAEGAKIPNSSGDEAGTNGGVTSGTNMVPRGAEAVQLQGLLPGEEGVLPDGDHCPQRDERQRPGGRADRALADEGVRRPLIA